MTARWLLTRRAIALIHALAHSVAPINAEFARDLARRARG